MQPNPTVDAPALAQIKPVVRYVDDEQAVIDTHFRLKPHLPESGIQNPKRVRVLLEVENDDGFHDETFAHVELDHLCGMVRMQMVLPEMWWPAGMGSQALYNVNLTLLKGRRILDKVNTTVGLTSVRVTDSHFDTRTFMVNGKPCEIHTIVPVDHVHEDALLPASGDSLIVVRDHYGSDSLFAAADLAGILMVQCVPIAADGKPERELADQISRLSSHPSLAGWCVSPQGRLSKRMAQQLKELDPIHPIIEHSPGNWAA
ncbi:MAG: hypothetical protein CMJ19_09220 [Phycisphaeraceae bacterium]|nr:hypothetical protein [Phycisphaeraceae bacterium]